MDWLYRFEKEQWTRKSVQIENQPWIFQWGKINEVFIEVTFLFSQKKHMSFPGLPNSTRYATSPMDPGKYVAMLGHVP